MQNTLVNHYRGVFQKIFLWSPTSRLDGSWAPVFEYMRRVLGQDTESIDPKEQCVFDTFNPEDLSRIVARQTSKCPTFAWLWTTSLREIYDACTSEPYSFMYYNALTNTFYCRFEHKVKIEEDES